MCIKVAILINWLRIFVPAGQRNATFWVLHSLIWANILFYVIGTLTEIFRCWPRQKIWDPWFEGGSCPINIEGQNISSSVFNLVSDTAILAMPQWIIWKLQMSRSRKWGLSLLFVIGIGFVHCNLLKHGHTANKFVVKCLDFWRGSRNILCPLAQFRRCDLSNVWSGYMDHLGSHDWIPYHGDSCFSKSRQESAHVGINRFALPLPVEQQLPKWLATRRTSMADVQAKTSKTTRPLGNHRVGNARRVFIEKH